MRVSVNEDLCPVEIISDFFLNGCWICFTVFCWRTNAAVATEEMGCLWQSGEISQKNASRIKI